MISGLNFHMESVSPKQPSSRPSRPQVQASPLGCSGISMESKGNRRAQCSERVLGFDQHSAFARGTTASRPPCLGFLLGPRKGKYKTTSMVARPTSRSISEYELQNRAHTFAPSTSMITLLSWADRMNDTPSTTYFASFSSTSSSNRSVKRFR